MLFFSTSRYGFVDALTRLGFSLVFIMLLVLLSPASLWALSGDEFLALCAESGPESIPAVRQAIEEGAEVNYVGPGGLRPLMVFVGSHSEAELETASALRAFLAAGADLNAQNDDGATALSFAVLRRSGPRLISLLLRNGADPNLGVSARGGLTPLMIAAGVEPDPLVSALLLAAGARTDIKVDSQGQNLGLIELAERNPNPKVTRFIESAVKKSRVEGGLPLFAEIPADPDLRTRIKNLDQRIRAQLKPDDWLSWLAYIKWQTEVDAAVDLRHSVFGNPPFEAWINEYVHYLSSLEESASPSALAVRADASSAKLIFQGDWAPDDWADFLAVAGREIIVVGRPGQGAVTAYRRATGEELWRYAPSVLSGLDLVKSPAGEELLLAASHWGGGFGDAALLEANSGAVLWELPALDNPRWTFSPDGGTLIVSTDYSLNLFDLRGRVRSAHSWFDLLEFKPWQDALAEARAQQNRLLAPLGLTLSEDGLFNYGHRFLFQGGPRPDHLMLAQSRQALAAHDYNNLEVLAVGPSGNVFILGPACGENCGAREYATPLFLADKKENLVDGLSVAGRLLAAGELAWIEKNGRRRPQLAFSPGGELLALGTAEGDLHFFSVFKGGSHLGALPASSLVDKDSGRSAKDFSLAAILDDAAGGKPFCALALKSNPDALPLIVEIDLAGQSASESFSPLPGRLRKLSAFAAYETESWAAALADGELWLVQPQRGTAEKIDVPPKLEWTALALADEGRRLVAVEKTGGLFICEAGRAPRRLALPLRDIRHLALNGEGTLAWAAAEEQAGEGRSGPALALVDLSGDKPPLVRPLKGIILSLRYSPAADYAVAVEDSPPDSGNIQFGAAPVERWSQGRADIIKFDHLQKDENQNVFYDPRKNFVGLGPDLSTLIFQHIQPSQAFVNLGRETLKSRETSEMDSSVYQARLGPAAFSADGRLALLPEVGRGGDGKNSLFKIGGAFFLYDLLSGREMGAMTDRRLHPEGLASAFLIDGGRRAVTAGWDGSVRLWDLSRAKADNILTWVWLEENNWLTVDKNGRFDTADLSSLSGAHWVASGRTAGIESFRDFYQPRLPGYVLNGNPMSVLEPVGPEMLFQPQVKIVQASPQKGSPGRMNVTVEVQAVEGDRRRPPRELRLYRNGKLVGLRKGEALSVAGGTLQAAFENIALPVGRSQAVFRAVAVNDQGLSSRPARASIKYKFKGEARPKLFMAAAGISDFVNTAWNIAEASASAKSLAAAAGKLKGESRINLLNGASPAPAKTEIEKAVKGLSAAGIDDSALLAVFSRGFTANGRFHLLPADVGGQGQALTPDLLAQSVSSGELGQWLEGVAAEEGLLIISSVPPEADGLFDPGPSGDRELALMAYDQGWRLLCLENGDGGGPAVTYLIESIQKADDFKSWLDRDLSGVAAWPGARLINGRAQ